MLMFFSPNHENLATHTYSSIGYLGQMENQLFLVSQYLAHYGNLVLVMAFFFFLHFFHHKGFRPKSDIPVTKVDYNNIPTGISFIESIS